MVYVLCISMDALLVKITPLFAGRFSDLFIFN
jgi:hypothetical protein